MDALSQKAKTIKLLMLDVDGVLTTGIIYYLSQDIEMKGFHIRDGLGIKLLQKSGVQVAVISGKHSEPVKRRLKELGIEHAFLGNEHKLPIYEELKKTLQLSDEQIAFMGDDLPDLPILRRVGLAITVQNVPEVIHDHADLVTKAKPGKGAVREVCEFIMKAQGQWDAMIKPFLTE